MPFLGDLERFAATSLYPWRFAIAAIVIGAGLSLAFLAARRGWLAAARRHPGRTGALVAAVLVVLTPAAWYLGSPLFVRTELQEAPPQAVIASPVPSAEETATAPPAASAPASVPPATPAPTPTAAPVVRSGSFVGADDFHFGRGRATLTEAPDGRHTLRFDGFSVRNGPDLFVYLSPNSEGYAKGAIELDACGRRTGASTHRFPPGPTSEARAVSSSGARSLLSCSQSLRSKADTRRPELHADLGAEQPDEHVALHERGRSGVELRETRDPFRDLGASLSATRERAPPREAGPRRTTQPLGPRSRPRARRTGGALSPVAPHRRPRRRPDRSWAQDGDDRAWSPGIPVGISRGPSVAVAGLISGPIEVRPRRGWCPDSQVARGF